MGDAFMTLVKALFARLTDEEGTLSSDTRAAIVARAGGGDGKALDGPLAEWVDTIADKAYRTTPEMVTAMRDAGLTEDAIFEATLCAAAGAAQLRLERGLRAIGKR